LTTNPNIQNFDINDLGKVSGRASPIFSLQRQPISITTDGNNNIDPSFNDSGAVRML
jgi:hypothetical protein